MSEEKCNLCKTRFLTAGKTLVSADLDELQRNTINSHYGRGYKIFKQGATASYVYYLKDESRPTTLFFSSDVESGIFGT